jgi:hypothetical protein
MPAIESDPVLVSLQEELKSQLMALNDAYHPVYGASNRQVSNLEARIAQLRADIAARRRDLVASA